MINKQHLLGNCRPKKDEFGFDSVGVHLFVNNTEYTSTNPSFVGTFFGFTVRPICFAHYAYAKEKSIQEVVIATKVQQRPIFQLNELAVPLQL